MSCTLPSFLHQCTNVGKGNNANQHEASCMFSIVLLAVELSPPLLNEESNQTDFLSNHRITQNGSGWMGTTEGQLAGPNFFLGYKSFSLWLALQLFSAIKYFFLSDIFKKILAIFKRGRKKLKTNSSENFQSSENTFQQRVQDLSILKRDAT